MKYTTRQSAILLMEPFFTENLLECRNYFWWSLFQYWYWLSEIFTDPSYFGQIMVATNAHMETMVLMKRSKSQLVLKSLD
jgi:carbamoyl-phosphate synthase small subunit